MSEQSQVVLVTGAMGQVGKRVTQFLLDRGRTVIALDLRNSGTEAAAAELASTPTGSFVPAYTDLTDIDAVRTLMHDHAPDAIIHLAAVVAPPCYRNPALARRVNVEGTRNLVVAGLELPKHPLFVEASSSGVYGSRNPHLHPERLTAQTRLNPVDCYGEDKCQAEKLVHESGLPFATLRLGAVISPDTLKGTSSDYGVLRRATPRDNRIHVVDVRDAALAFANAVDRGEAVDGKVLLIGGDESCVMLQRDLEDDIMTVFGIGRLGSDAGLPGDPADERGWGLTDWFDASEAQALLDFQKHTWQETLGSLQAELGFKPRVLRLFGPIARPLMRRQMVRQQRREGRGPYADPWRLISSIYGDEVLASSGRGGSSAN